MQRIRVFFSKGFGSVKGSVLTEFSLSILLLIFIIVSILEFGFEIFAHNVTDRLTNRAALTYSLTRDLSALDAIFDNQADAITSQCLSEPDVVLFDSVSSINPLMDSGRKATRTSLDDSAVMFRLSIECDWSRLMPNFGGVLGSPSVYRSVIVGRFLEDGL